ncbi:MAG: hypothetical protein V1798_09325 [Pseudomonadota bacterium]
MAEFSIKGPQTGSVELLLALPILFLLALGIGYLGEALIEKSRVERAAWTYAVSRAHGADSQKARAVIESWGAGKGGGTFTERETSACNPLWIGWVALLSSLPTSFRAVVGFDCGHDIEVTAGRHVPEVIRGWIQSTDSGAEFSPELTLKSRDKIPGSSFEKSETLRQALWLEAMIKAGFGPLPLPLLGISDLAQAVADVGLGILGTPVAEALSSAQEGSAAGDLASELSRGTWN